MMNDWTITGAAGVETPSEGWVYYICPAVAAFANIHFSRYAFDPLMDHIATNDRRYYYYGFTDSFNTAVPAAIAAVLRQAWRNYFTT